MDQAKNFAKSSLASGILDTDTELTVLALGGLKFPATPFNATIWNSTDYPDPADDPSVEIVRVTSVTDDTFTITRGQEETTARDHSEVSKTYNIIAGLTAKVINTDLPSIAETGDGANYSISMSGEFSVSAGTSVVISAEGGDMSLAGTSIKHFGLLATDQTAAASTAVGTLVAKIPIRDNGGTLIGYIPLYDSIA